MESYQRKVIMIKLIYITILFPVIACTAQKVGISLEKTSALQYKADSILENRLKESINFFLSDKGTASLLLSNPESLKFLKKYSSQLRDKLFQKYQDRYNRQVLGLLELPQYMKDTLLRYKRTELEVRAGLGDKVAQQEIIKMYMNFLKRDIKSEQELYQYLHKPKLTEALLLYIGTYESLRIFIEGMRTNDVYKNSNVPNGYPPNKESVFSDLLASYSGLIGQDPIVSGFYIQNFLYVENEQEFGIEHKQYFRVLEKYFKKKHGVEIEIEAPYLILGREYYTEH